MIEIGELAEDALCRRQSPMNVYYHDGSVDSAHSSGESSRRNSNPFGDFKDFIKRRRNCPRLANRYHQQQTVSCLSMNEGVRKASIDSQFCDMDASDDDTPPARCQRRFSVPEKVLLNADYAILRSTKERRFEIVAAFDKYADPYRQYMQSLMCYDLAPSHGAVVLIDSALKVHKALLALGQSGYNAAIIINSEISSAVGILTITDCLRVITVAANEDPDIGELTVKQFLHTYNGRKRLVTAPANLSVWDAARLFCLNHVHRIPILQTAEGMREADVLYLLSLRTILQETVMNLVETAASLAPHLKQRTLQESSIGTWTNVITVSSDASCAEVIDIFLDGKISCLAVLDDFGKVVGTISKQDIMKELARHSQDYLDILDVLVRDVYRPQPYALASNTIFEAIGLLIASDQQCLFVVDTGTGEVLAAVAFVDIMEYILNSDEIHHKMKTG
uniref:5'-AMP-activated protein kinase subunit gamma-1 n=1 Tax=Ascaris suum TaxID=6253 RepID=F1L237_ASCSU